VGFLHTFHIRGKRHLNWKALRRHAVPNPRTRLRAPICYVVDMHVQRKQLDIYGQRTNLRDYSIRMLRVSGGYRVGTAMHVSDRGVELSIFVSTRRFTHQHTIILTSVSKVSLEPVRDAGSCYYITVSTASMAQTEDPPSCPSLASPNMPCRDGKP
jgi:hypothetical protein